MVLALCICGSIAAFILMAAIIYLDIDATYTTGMMISLVILLCLASAIATLLAAMIYVS